MTFIKRNSKYVIMFVVMFLLLLIGTFCDLQISRALADVEVGKYYSTNFLAVFFESFGEMPVYIVPTIALGVLFFYLKKISKLPKWLNITLMVVIFVFSIGFNYYGSHKLLKYYNIHVNTLKITGMARTAVEGAMGVIFTALWFFIASLVKEKHLKSAAICSLIVVLTTALSQGAVQLVKPIFGRARYRLMNVTGDFSEFTCWYEINIGKSVSLEQLQMGVEKDGYKSFPSGHTAAASVVFALMSIPVVFKLDKTTDRLITAACCLLVFIVAFSRILMGAHYLTDVTMGAILTLLSYVLSQFIVFSAVKRCKGQKSTNA